MKSFSDFLKKLSGEVTLTNEPGRSWMQPETVIWGE